MTKLLIIDPQNDFCPQQDGIPFKPALPVPGALDDMSRIADLLNNYGMAISEVIVTLDSHPFVAIERPAFWKTGTGEDVAPFTVITSQDIRVGNFAPRDPDQIAHALKYTEALALGGKYELMIWPTHCVVGTWGHAIPPILSSALDKWAFNRQRNVTHIMKGMNPLTEQYSAVKPEVAVDFGSLPNTELISKAFPHYEGLLIAGEASSHCVRATVLDLLPTIDPEFYPYITLLTDCMSPVSGFEKQQDEFFDYCRSLGIKTTSAYTAANVMTVSE